MGALGGLRMLRVRNNAGTRRTRMISQKISLFFLGYMNQNLHYLSLKKILFSGGGFHASNLKVVRIKESHRHRIYKSLKRGFQVAERLYFYALVQTGGTCVWKK